MIRLTAPEGVNLRSIYNDCMNKYLSADTQVLRNEAISELLNANESLNITRATVLFLFNRVVQPEPGVDNVLLFRVIRNSMMRGERL